MDLKNLTVFSLANQNMRYLTAKERIIAANVANASTPNYLPQDIEKPDFFSDVKEAKHSNLTMYVTNNKHFSGLKGASQKAGGITVSVYTPQPKDALTIDGNGVIVEDQMNEASKASAEYRKMITIYNSYKNMLSTANTKING